MAQLSAADFDLVAKAPLLAGLSRDDLGLLTAGAHAEAYPEAELLFSQGDRADRFFVVLAGRVSLFALTESGDQSIIEVFDPICTFAEAAIFSSGIFPLNCEVAAGSRLVHVPAQPFMKRLADHPALGLTLLAGLARWQRMLIHEIVYSMSEKRNSILACHVPWEKRLGNSFRFGVSRIPGFTEVAPVIEYALGKKCGLRADITGRGGQAWAYLFLSPSARPLYRGGFAVEVSPQGSRLVWYPLDGAAIGLTPYGSPKWTAGTTYKLALQRDNYMISATVDGFCLGPVTITDPAQKQLLDEPQRFKFYGWQGGLYTIQNAILQDGPP